MTVAFLMPFLLKLVVLALTLLNNFASRFTEDLARVTWTVLELRIGAELQSILPPCATDTGHHTVSSY